MGSHAQVKIIGVNGQISLGKAFAGKTVIVEQFIPDSEKWLYEPKHLAKLEKALHWAEKTKRADNLKVIAKEIEHGKD